MSAFVSLVDRTRFSCVFPPRIKKKKNAWPRVVVARPLFAQRFMSVRADMDIPTPIFCETGHPTTQAADAVDPRPSPSDLPRRTRRADPFSGRASTEAVHRSAAWQVNKGHTFGRHHAKRGEENKRYTDSER